MTKLISALIMVIPSVLFAQNSSQTSKPVSAGSYLAANYGRIPLSFEANRGQTGASVQFLAHGQGYTLFLRQCEVMLALHRAKLSIADADMPANPHNGSAINAYEIETSVVRVRLVGANTQAKVRPEDEQITKTNYFIGNDPAQWRTGVPNYGRVRYAGIYPGIDLVYYGNQGRLEHDFVVAPGGDPGRIAFVLKGAGRLRIDPASGDLIVTRDRSEVRLLKPVTFQDADGQPTHITSSYKILAGNKIGFIVGTYDHARSLVIDPVLVYSTYLGGSGNSTGSGDRGNGIAVDDRGHSYLVGTTYSVDFPATRHAFQVHNNAVSASVATVFVAKLNERGTELEYSTYLGGSGGDFGYGIALDAANNAFVTGATYSTDFPVTCGAFQTTRSTTTPGAPTGFVAKLSSAGHRLRYSTYLGGTGQPLSGKGDVAQAIAVNDAGNAYVTGYTYSSDFPVTDKAFQASFAGGPFISNGFVTKLNLTGTALKYSTYLGGSGSFGGNGDFANAIAIDAFGDAFITGLTYSPDFPVTEGVFETRYTPSYAAASEAFVTKLDPKGAREVYSTFLGSGDMDSGQAIAVDNKGFAYVAGQTSSTNFPVTSGVVQSSSLGMGFPLGFVSKLNFDGTDLVYSTYLEGQQTSILGLAVDGSGSAYVAGTAPPENSGLYGGFQVTPDALSLPAGSTAAFMVKLDPAASVLNYATLIGGSVGDGATSVAIDPSGSAYLTGYSNSVDFPVSPQSFQSANANVSGGNAFVAKFALANEINQTAYPASVGLISTTLRVFVFISNVQCGPPTYDMAYGWNLAANAPGPALGGTVNFTLNFPDFIGDHSSTSSTPGPFEAYPASTFPFYYLNHIALSDGGPIQLSVSGNYSGDANYQSSSASASTTDPGCPPATSVVNGNPSYALKPATQVHVQIQTAQEKGPAPSVLTPTAAQSRAPSPKFTPPAIVYGIGPVPPAISSADREARSEGKTGCIAPRGRWREDHDRDDRNEHREAIDDTD